MRRLLLMRHGKSDWDFSAARDHDRPLAKRGKKAARLMGSYLTRVDCTPGLILSSPAVRARKTAELARRHAGWDCPARMVPKFYAEGPNTVLEEIRAETANVETILAVGHEPTWSELAGRLVGGASIRMPTAAAACIEFGVTSWARIGERPGQLIWLVNPRLLEAAGWPEEPG